MDWNKKKSSGQQRGEKQKWKSLIGCGRRCHRAAIRDSASSQRLLSLTDALSSSA